MTHETDPSRIDIQKLLAPILVLSLLPIASAVAQTVHLVRQAEPLAVVVLPKNASAIEQDAAAELIRHIRLISDVTLDTVTAGGSGDEAAGLVPIYLGQAVPARDRQRWQDQLHDPASFALIVGQDRISIFDVASQIDSVQPATGVRNGVYELLEQLGVRWFMPGDIGTVIPTQQTLVIKTQETVQNPSFASRWQHPSDKAWQQRMRMGGPLFGASAHGIPPFAGSLAHRQKMLEQYPETFSFNARSQKRTISQQCLSNPKTIAMAVEAAKAYFESRPDQQLIGMGANDWAGFCECDGCKALDAGDWDPFSHEISMTDRYVWFFNQVLAGLEEEFPEKGVAFYIYHAYMRPPVNVKPHPRLVGALAPIALCRVHGMDNPICPEKQYFAWLAKEWGKHLTRVYDRGYWFNLADPGLPFPMVHRIRADVPMMAELGIYGWRVETLTHWASESPSLYIGAKLMWDHTADVDALMQDYADKFFGPASEPMLAYLLLMNASIRDSDHHVGSAFDMSGFYPQDIRRQARQHLEHASKLASDGLYAKRVAATCLTFDYLETFLSMLENTHAQNWPEAKAALDRIETIQDELINGFEIPMIHPRFAQAYFKRFFRMATDQGYARTINGNRPIAKLDHTWDFLIDTQRVGETLGYHRAEIKGGNWQQIPAHAAAWTHHGLRYYKGEAWYRQWVTIPDTYKNDRVFLWFGGVDEKAKVYVNGQAVGISHGGAFVPFEVDATDAVRFGEPNLVAVRVINDRLDELGTGGITGPAMFYIPAAGQDAELENIREMGRTFP